MKHLAIFFLILLLNINTYSQDYVDDAALWTDIVIKKKLSEKFEIELAQKNRFNDNFNEFGRISIGGGVKYNVTSNISLTAGYTLIARKMLENDYSTRHRLNLALQAKKNWGRVTLKYRLLLQARLKDVYSSEFGRLPVWVLRNKFIGTYELNKRFTPYLAYELFYPLYQQNAIGFIGSRSFIGTEYKLSRQTNLDFYFLYQRQLNAMGPTHRVFVYGIGIEHKF